MKKVVLASVLAVGVLFAHEPVEHEAEKAFYVVPKWIHNYGDTYRDEKGDHGNGVGLDLGYRLGHGFAIEIDGTYETSDVRVDKNGVIEEENVKYLTTSLDLAYTYEMTESLGILFKVGYEYEREKIAGESNHDTGLIYAAGIEYKINEDFKFVTEYEKSTIDGPKGDMVTAGIMYNFDL